MTRFKQQINLGKHRAAQTAKSVWFGALASIAIQKMRQSERRSEENRPRQNRLHSATKIRKHVSALNKTDHKYVAEGLLPANKLAGLPDIIDASKRAVNFTRDADTVNSRRKARQATEVRTQNSASKTRFPAYYLQNFHYQTDGWLSTESAELYDTQVEALFFGTAETMRRAGLAEITKLIAQKGCKDTRLLEIGCGNGNFLKMLADVWPRLNLTGLDLSPHYLDVARQKLSHVRNVDLVQGMAETMPFEDQSFDIVLASYLFHELPPKIRRKTIGEIKRVLKPGGKCVLVDSLQLGDTPELDPMLKFFPKEFHEPFYNSYLTQDFTKLFTEHNMVQIHNPKLAFLTKVTIWENAPAKLTE